MAVRAQAVDRGAPTDLGAPSPQPAKHAAKAGWQLILLDRRGLEIRMRTGNQSAPGKRDDPAAMPRGIKRQDKVDHGQARAYDQRISTIRSQIIDCGAGFRAPGIADEANPEARECL